MSIAIITLQSTPPPGWRFVAPSPQVLALDDPAAGADWAYKLPTNRLAKLKAVNAKLTTSATAATRAPQLQVKTQNGRLVIGTLLNVPLTEGESGILYWATGYGMQTHTSYLVSPGLPFLTLPPGCTVLSVTTTLKAGDQWSTITLLVELL